MYKARIKLCPARIWHDLVTGLPLCFAAYALPCHWCSNSEKVEISKSKIKTRGTATTWSVCACMLLLWGAREEKETWKGVKEKTPLLVLYQLLVARSPSRIHE